MMVSAKHTLHIHAVPLLLCRHPEQDKLVIKVLDMDSLSQDEHLGETAVLLEGLLDGIEHGLDLQLDDSQPPASVQLKLRYLPFSGGDPRLHIMTVARLCPLCPYHQR